MPRGLSKGLKDPRVLLKGPGALLTGPRRELRALGGPSGQEGWAPDPAGATGRCREPVDFCEAEGGVVGGSGGSTFGRALRCLGA